MLIAHREHNNTTYVDSVTVMTHATALETSVNRLKCTMVYR